VRTLFELYVYDMSEFMDLDVGDDGAFVLPKSLPNYWSTPGENQEVRWEPEWRGHPFLIRVDGKLAGFALVKQLSSDPPSFDMGEFFVMRKYRRHRVGARVACSLFDRFCGQWEVREMPANLAAQSFWRRLIAEYTHDKFEEGQEFFATYQAEFIVQRFDSRARE
jgi:predicted acetyltransferase